MLQTFPTESGTGITIYGNYGDLQILYDTIHHFSETLNQDNGPQKGQFQLLMNFAYEVRKSYSGQRLIDELSFDGDDIKHKFYGFKLVWTDLLIFLSVLRFNAGYSQSDKLQQAVLYFLEYAAEKALYDYDPEGANVIKNYIGQGINITDEDAFIIYQALHIKYVTMKPGKERFRMIPELINNHFSSWREEYKDLLASFSKSAKDQNCEVADLEFAEFPEIIW